MSRENTREAVSSYMDSTKKEEAVCKNCGQKITRWTLPQCGHFSEHEAWYHVCVDPVGLNHFSLHTANDCETNPCYKPEPKEISLNALSKRRMRLFAKVEGCCRSQSRPAKVRGVVLRA